MHTAIHSFISWSWALYQAQGSAAWCWRGQPAASSHPSPLPVTSLLPLLESQLCNSPGPGFSYSSKACWHKVPFKAPLEVCVGWGGLKPFSFQRRAKCAPPRFCSLLPGAQDRNSCCSAPTTGIQSCTPISEDPPKGTLTPLACSWALLQMVHRRES